MLIFIDPDLIERLLDRRSQQQSPEELLIEIEDAIESGRLSKERIQELINNF